MSKPKPIKDENLTFTLEYKKPKAIWRNILIVLGALLLTFLISIALLYRSSKKYIEKFAQAAQVSETNLKEELQLFNHNFLHYYQNPDQTLKEKTFLILGGDQLSGRDGDPVLTDTILLARFDLNSAQTKTLSLPRDIYNDAYQTKINALYHYGLERDSENPLFFPNEVIAEMTGLTIDHTLLINIEDLEELIDLLGGVEIDVPVPFTDPLFPRQDVDVSVETDPAILYEEIVFEQGLENMTGQRALQYMRSRHSNDDEGTDLARAQRQQLVLAALMKKAISFDMLLKNPELSGQLYRFYLDHFAKDLNLNELSKIVFSLIINLAQTDTRPTQLEIESMPLTVYPDEEAGLLVNPPLWQTNQEWRYEIKDQALFRSQVADFFENK